VPLMMSLFDAVVGMASSPWQTLAGRDSDVHEEGPARLHAWLRLQRGRIIVIHPGCARASRALF
jgi:hypothetical protein